jgi:tetratricopeptide (TPR) repeat protein
MNNNKNANPTPRFMASLCLVSIIFVIILAAAASILYYQNVRLKTYNAGLEKSVISLNESIRCYQGTSMTQGMFQKEALDYLRWRFVLKEQVEQAGRRFSGKTAGARKDRELANLIYYNLGLAHTLAYDFEAAINDFQEALKYDSKDAYSYYNLALLFSTYKETPEKALDCYRKYQEIAPQGLYRAEVRSRIAQLEEMAASKGQK